MDILEALFTDHVEVHGDRAFGDDPAMYCAMACLDGAPVMVICNRKGRTTKDRMKFRFGSPEPEGYRKALRCMKLAEKFNRPVVTVLDLAGAYPGLGAEERGQGEAIARNLLEMSQLRTPTLTVITGEGGSGGALALAVADRVLMLENANLLRHLARRLRQHHVEGCRQAPAGGGGAQVHGKRRKPPRLRGRGSLQSLPAAPRPTPKLPLPSSARPSSVNSPALQAVLARCPASPALR